MPKNSVIQNLLSIVFIDFTLPSEDSEQSNYLLPEFFFIVRLFFNLTEFGLQLDSAPWIFPNLNGAGIAWFYITIDIDSKYTKIQQAIQTGYFPSLLVKTKLF